MTFWRKKDTRRDAVHLLEKTHELAQAAINSTIDAATALADQIKRTHPPDLHLVDRDVDFEDLNLR